MPTKSAPIAVPKAFGLAAPSTAKSDQRGGDRIEQEIGARRDVAAAEPGGEQHAAPAAAGRRVHTGNHVGHDLVVVDIGCRSGWPRARSSRSRTSAGRDGSVSRKIQTRMPITIRKMTDTGMRSSSRTRSMRWRPMATGRSGEKVPSAVDPSGSVMPVAIERPSVGMRWRPTKRNIMPSVARRSGTLVLTISKAIDEPDEGAHGKAGNDGHEGRLFEASPSCRPASIIEEVATEPIDRSKPPTTRVQVTQARESR